MATKTSDKRAATISTTRSELATLLGDKATELGLIDFAPDEITVDDNGELGFEITFRADTPPGA